MKKTITLLFLSLICSFAYAAPLTQQQKQQAVSKINAATKGLKSMICTFTQTKHLSMLDDKMISQGKMYYDQPDKLRWEYNLPYKYIFILNKTKIFVGNNSRKDIIDINANKIFGEVARIMMSTVTGTVLGDSSDFSFDVAEADGQWRITLVPKKKEMKMMFSEIVMFFGKTNGLVSEIDIFENNKDCTTIKLGDVKVNGTINESLFAIPE